MSHGYREVRGAAAPCGHVHGGAVGPRRPAASTTPPPATREDVTCFCGARYTVVTEPILLVIGYKARVLPAAPEGGAPASDS